MTDDTTQAERRVAAVREGLDARQVGLYAVLVVMIGFYLVPIETGLVTSFKTLTGISKTPPFLLPPGKWFTFENWRTAWSYLAIGMWNSALFAIPATVLSALLGSFAAYGLTQVDWKYQVPILTLFVAGVFIPYQAVLVPLSRFWTNYVNFQDLLGVLWYGVGVPASYHGLLELIVTHVAYGIPICTVLFRSYYKAMDEEMFEAARLDGASVRRTYRRIVFPLSKPMFAVVLIYQFTQIWNDLLFALVLVSSQASPAAPVVLKLSGLGTALSGTDFGLRMAGALIAAVPTLIVYIMFGEEFAEGVAT